MQLRIKSVCFTVAPLLLALTVPLFPMPYTAFPTLAQATQGRKTEADRLYEQGVQQFHQGLFREAVQTLQQVLTRRRELKDRTGEAQALTQLGEVYAWLNWSEPGLKASQSALALWRELKERKGEAEALTWVGEAYSLKEDNAKALDILQQALMIRREVSDHAGEGKTLISIGAIAYKNGQTAKAVEALQQARTILHKADIGNAQQFLKTALPKLTGYQIPSFDLAQPTGTTQPLYFIPPKQRTAQAVVTQVSGSQADIWLGGLDYITLSALAPGSTFALLDEMGQSTGQVTLNSRQGLTARAMVQGNAQPGTLLRETSRVIPNDFRLRMGLDPSLGNELAAIQADLEQLGRVKAVPAQTGERPYPEGVDYILSRVTPAYQALIKQGKQPPLNSVALFAPNLELLPNSFGQPGESAQAALKRLYPKLQSLIAAQLVRQTLNANTSNLKVDVQINVQNQPEFIVAKAGSLGGQGSDSSPVRALPLNTPIQFQLDNQDTTPLYFLVMLVNPDGQLEILFPNLYTLGDLKTISQVSPQTNRLVPNPNQGDAFTLAQNTLGRSEVLVIASPKPLDTAFKQLQTLVSEQPQQNPFRTSRSTDAIADLLSNLGTRTSQTSYTLGTNDLVTLSIPFEVIPN